MARRLCQIWCAALAASISACATTRPDAVVPTGATLEPGPAPQSAPQPRPPQLEEPQTLGYNPPDAPALPAPARTPQSAGPPIGGLADHPDLPAAAMPVARSTHRRSERTVNADRALGVDADDEADRRARLIASARGRMASLSRCGDRTGRNPSGVLAFRITVSPDGAVSDVIPTHDTIRSPPVSRCAATRIGGWTFLAPGERTTFEVKALFTGG